MKHIYMVLVMIALAVGGYMVYKRYCCAKQEANVKIQTAAPEPTGPISKPSSSYKS